MNIASVSPSMEGMPAGSLTVRTQGERSAPVQSGQVADPEMIAGTQTADAAAAAGQVAGGRRAGEDAQQQPGGHQPSEAEIQEAIDEVRRVIEPVARNLQFSVDDDTNLTLIKVVDSATDEVIRQIPSEEMVAIAKAIDKLQGMLQQGVLLRDKA